MTLQESIRWAIGTAIAGFIFSYIVSKLRYNENSTSKSVNPIQSPRPEPTKPQPNSSDYEANRMVGQELLEFLSGISDDEFLEMIKRNTPLKVDGIEDDGWCGWRAVCPECRGSVVSVDAYCVYCGQKLDWSN